jgi:hypothetical protein
MRVTRKSVIHPFLTLRRMLAFDALRTFLSANAPPMQYLIVSTKEGLAVGFISGPVVGFSGSRVET